MVVWAKGFDTRMKVGRALLALPHEQLLERGPSRTAVSLQGLGPPRPYPSCHPVVLAQRLSHTWVVPAWALDLLQP